MKTLNYDAPIDKIAALVVSKNNDTQMEFNNKRHITSMYPLPTHMFRGLSHHDLTGKRCGRFTVVGCALFKSKSKTNSTRWVVKCACGRYQMLSTKAVKNNHKNSMCVVCTDVQAKKNKKTLIIRPYEKGFGIR